MFSQMSIQYSDCQSIYEQVVVWAMGISILIAVISGVALFSSEKVNGKKELLTLELLGPLHPLFTTKYLSRNAIKWRYPFFTSVLVIVLCVVCFNVFGVCAANT